MVSLVRHLSPATSASMEHGDGLGGTIESSSSLSARIRRSGAPETLGADTLTCRLSSPSSSPLESVGSTSTSLPKNLSDLRPPAPPMERGTRLNVLR